MAASAGHLGALPYGAARWEWLEYTDCLLRPGMIPTGGRKQCACQGAAMPAEWLAGKWLINLVRQWLQEPRPWFLHEPCRGEVDWLVAISVAFQQHQ
jgi:hypothetical protein